MNKRAVSWVACFAIAALMISGGLFASRMAWKKKVVLKAAPAAFTGLNPLALPCEPTLNLATAKDLIDDVGATTGQTPVGVAVYNAADGFTTYSPPAPGNFPIACDEAYLVQMPGPGNVNYTFSGAEAPCWPLSLNTATPQNQNFVALPANLGHATAFDLINEINSDTPACGVTASAYFNVNGGFTSYAPPAPGNFNLLLYGPPPPDSSGPIDNVLIQVTNACTSNPMTL